MFLQSQTQNAFKSGTDGFVHKHFVFLLIHIAQIHLSHPGLLIPWPQLQPMLYSLHLVKSNRLPLDDPVGEELVNELHVVGLELLGIGDTVALAVQVIGVESLDSLHHLPVLVAHEVAVSALTVPGVEGVVADHGQGLVGERGLVLDDVVEVLVVAPAEHDVVETAVGRVDAVLGVVVGVGGIGVALSEGGRVDAAVREGAADSEGVADDVPLALGAELREEDHELAEVVDETSQLHPAGLAIAADGLGGLEKVLDLGEGGIGVRLVDQGVELLHGLPDGHLGARAGGAVEAVAGLQVVGDGLLVVLLAVEVLDAVVGVLVVAEGSLVLLLVELGLGVVLGGIDLVDLVGHGLELGTGLVGDLHDSSGSHCEVCVSRRLLCLCVKRVDGSWR